MRDVVDDEGEGVDQCRDEAGVRDPTMEDLELLVADTCDRRDEITLACSGEDEWQTGKGKPARSCSDRWRVSEVKCFRSRPVVRLRCECHAEEVDGSDGTDCQNTQRSSRPIQSRNSERSIAHET